MSRQTTLGSLFDGIGGALLCASICGAKPVWASEIEKFPIAVTKHHFPDVIHLGDITKINGAEIPPVNIIVGGSPCQDLSVAGKRAGMAGSRSGLFMDQIRIIKEMRDKFGADYPRFMVWENVPGAFSSNGGEDFRAVLEETARIADSTVSIPRSVTGWANSGSVLGVGFSISWRTIDAQYWGVPQRRRRIYLVADFGGQSAPEILFEREGLSGHPEKSGDKGQGTAGYVAVSFGESGPGYWRDGIDVIRAEGENRPSRPSNVICSATQQGGAERLNDLCPTITASAGMAGNMGPWIAKSPAVLSMATKQQSQNIGENVAMPLMSNDYKEPQVVFDARGSGECDIAPCMTGDHQNRITDYTALVMAFAQNQRDEVRDLCNIAGAIASELGMHQQTFVMAHGQTNAEILHDQSPTLNCNHEQPIVSYSIDEEKNGETEKYGTLQNRGTGGGFQGCVKPGNSSTVRRLTPLECERLQGYPDNYTNIPGASDSARYKALGNSFNIQCALFVISGCINEIRRSDNAT